VACLGASTAIFRIVLLALGGARIADLGAEAAEVLGETGAAAHERCGREARIDAVVVEANAICHRVDVGLA